MFDYVQFERIRNGPPESGQVTFENSVVSSAGPPRPDGFMKKLTVLACENPVEWGVPGLSIPVVISFRRVIIVVARNVTRSERAQLVLILIPGGGMDDDHVCRSFRFHFFPPSHTCARGFRRRSISGTSSHTKGRNMFLVDARRQDRRPAE